MTVASDVRDRMRPVLERAAVLYAGRPSEDRVRQLLARLDDPLRVAIAGQVKAGKSTLLNALVGEQLAPTDAGECTRIVTWYLDGVTYRVTLHPVEGEPFPARFRRADGALRVDLGGRRPDQVERLAVEWPSQSLRSLSLIDTPGIGSLSADTRARTLEFLTPSEDRDAGADAVIYLMRHLHGADARFLEAFHDEVIAQPMPVNAIGVLSRADEIAGGRLDSMASAAQIAGRYRDDAKLRRLVQTVVPVAGLIAQAGAGLREAEFRGLRHLAGLDATERRLLLLTADRFVADRAGIDVVPLERRALLERLGMFGVRLSIALLSRTPGLTATDLANHLRAVSGIDRLRMLLLDQFSGRADLLKLRSALSSMSAIATADPVAGSDELLDHLERIATSAHELSELRLLNALHMGLVELQPDELEAAKRLVGSQGSTVANRLGLGEDAEREEIVVTAADELRRWRGRAENPTSSRAIVDAAEVLARTCEGIIAALTTADR